VVTAEQWTGPFESLAPSPLPVRLLLGALYEGVGRPPFHIALRAKARFVEDWRRREITLRTCSGPLPFNSLVPERPFDPFGAEEARRQCFGLCPGHGATIVSAIKMHDPRNANPTSQIPRPPRDRQDNVHARLHTCPQTTTLLPLFSPSELMHKPPVIVPHFSLVTSRR
jgi:hypothetical protein